MGPNFAAGAVLVPMLKLEGGGRVITMDKAIKLVVRYNIFYRKVDVTTTSDGSRGGHWYSGPAFRCGSAIKVHIKDAATEQGGSLHGIILINKTAVEFYMIFYPQSGMLLGSE